MALLAEWISYGYPAGALGSAAALMRAAVMPSSQLASSFGNRQSGRIWGAFASRFSGNGMSGELALKSVIRPASAY